MTHHKIIIGHCLEALREMQSESVNMIMTSPPYWGLRNYGEGTSTIWGGNPNCEHEWGERIPPRGHKSGKHGPGSVIGAKKGQNGARRGSGSTFCQKCGAWRGQLGLEPTWQMYVEHLVEISRELKRILRKDGSYYLTLGDTYAGSGMGYGSPPDPKHPNARNGKIKPRKTDIPAKCKLLMPYRVAFPLIDDGWICRNDVTWYKPNAMPSSVKDRLTCKTEVIFHFVKSRKYYYDLDAIREPHKTGTPQANRDIKRMMAGRTQYDGKWAEGKDTQAAFVAGHPLGKNHGDVFRNKTANQEKIMSMRNAPEPGEPHAFHELSKNPGDVYFVDRQQAYRHHGSGPGDRSGFPNKHPLGNNPGDFWEINTRPYPDAHFAVYPEDICIKPILSSCPPDGVVLDPCLGRGTTTKVARDNGRNSIGIEIQPSYLPIIKKYLEIDQQQQRLGVTYEVVRT